MLEELRGPPQDEDDTATPEGSPDPTLLIAAAGGRFEHHPLFPRADGSPETRDIRLVSFCRKRTSDRAMQNCPEDIPAREIKSWAQVVAWWGGGEYKAIAKDGKHRIVAWFPSAPGEWLSFEGESKPFVRRSANGHVTPGVAVASLLTSGAGREGHHPLFPRADGSPETRDIVVVSFCRKRTGDHAMQNSPEDIPARDVKSWAQVVAWWGGGEYKAIAKDGKHRIVAWFPNATDEWLSLEGDSKPFLLRNGKAYATPGIVLGPASPNPLAFTGLHREVRRRT